MQKMTRKTISSTVAALGPTTNGVASEQELHASSLMPHPQHERKSKGQMEYRYWERNQGLHLIVLSQLVLASSPKQSTPSMGNPFVAFSGLWSYNRAIRWVFGASFPLRR